MARISDEEIAAVRSRADIVEIIGHYLPVSKKGKSYVALCPFHDDHDPSMSISPDKQIYKCFVCGAGGGVFQFVQNYEKISFPEAVSRVAELVGYPLSVDVSGISEQTDPTRKKLYQILDETIKYTMYEINTDEGKAERSYCENRGLDQNVREQFQIGFNPSGDALYKFLSAKGYEDQNLVSCNVVRTSQTGIHDVFSSRITFPIHDEKGRPIGFSARAVDPENTSKYINTNDTDLFHKGEIVYNLHRARTSSRRESEIYVCEGVTDVIAFYRAGIENCVCTLGTSCTEHQIRLLKNTSPKLVFCYDGDEAGQTATWRACKMAQKAGCQVAIVKNKTGKDPDEIIRNDGPEALKKIASDKITWIEFAIDYLKNRYNLENYEEKKEFAHSALAEISLLHDDLDKQHFTDVVSEISGFHLEYEPGQNIQRTTAKIPATVQTPDGTKQAEEMILSMMLAHNEAIQRFSEKLGYLTDSDRNSIAMLIIDTFRRNGDIDAVELMDKAGNSSIQELLSRLITSWTYELPYDEKIMDGAIRKIQISIISAQADELSEELKKPMNNTSKQILLNKYQDCLRTLRRYIDEENS